MVYSCFLVDALSCIGSFDDESDTLALFVGQDECWTDRTSVQADVGADSSDELWRQQGAAAAPATASCFTPHWHGSSVLKNAL